MYAKTSDVGQSPKKSDSLTRPFILRGFILQWSLKADRDKLPAEPTSRCRARYLEKGETLKSAGFGACPADRTRSAGLGVRCGGKLWRCVVKVLSCSGYFLSMLRMPAQKRKSFFRMARSARIKTPPSSHLEGHTFLYVARQGIYFVIALARRSRASAESKPGRLAQNVRRAARWMWASGFRSKWSSGCSGSSQSPHGFRPAWMI
jgi:hypothetical protein